MVGVERAGIVRRLSRRAPSIKAIERLLLPNTCVACERPVGRADPDALVCGVCRSRLVPVVGGCTRCQQPRPPVGPCRYCADWPGILLGMRSAVWLGEEATAMVHHLKYDGYARLGRKMAEIIASRVSHPTEAMVVPIPLAPGRLRQRGFNQAEVIAAALAVLWCAPLGSTVLSRVRETRTQTRLDPEARARNVQGAFRARPPHASGEGAGPAIILVDDVLTTGATLLAAVAALDQAGWTSVRAMTFTRARPFAERVTVA